MAVLDGKSAYAAAFFRQDVRQEDVAQAERVGADQLGRLAGHVCFDEGDIAGHLRFHGLRRQRLGKGFVIAGVDKCGEMLKSIIHRAECRLDFQCAEDTDQIFPGGVAGADGICEFIDIASQRPGIERFLRIAGRDLDENLVLQPDVAESQFCVQTRPRHQFDDVLLITEFGSEEGKYQRRGNQHKIQHTLVPLEISVDRKKNPVHCFGL